MSKASDTAAILAGTLHAVTAVLNTPPRSGTRPIGNFAPDQVGKYFDEFERGMAVLREDERHLFADFTATDIEPQESMVMGPNHFRRTQLEQLQRDIQQVLTIRASSTAQSANESAQREARVFLTHGRSEAWHSVQAFIEKDLGMKTLELAQEPNLGRTILEKLMDSAKTCNSAVIVMTGDDTMPDGGVRARENVIHEIGLFQGLYGLGRICLLYEEGTNIPSNIGGLAYLSFPKGSVHACFGTLMRELKAMHTDEHSR